MLIAFMKLLVSSDLLIVLLLLLTLIASNTGISLRMLVKSVFHFEIQLSNWILEERRKNIVNEDGNSQSEDE
jgi:hypothetical protein